MGVAECDAYHQKKKKIYKSNQIVSVNGYII